MPGATKDPRFVPHSLAEAARHASYLLVTVAPWPAAKSLFLTTIAWHTRAAGMPATTTAAEGRVRTLAEREPLNGVQARQRAGEFAARYGVPVILTIGC